MLKHRKNSSSILLATHRIDDAEYLCDKIGIIVKGKFVSYESPKIIENLHAKGYTINFKPASFEIDQLDSIKKFIINDNLLIGEIEEG
jgi:ABC-type multidrug transport system ATPase subunit